MRSNGGPATTLIVLLTVIWATVLSSAAAYAHCDALDGPVVKAAQQALASGNVALVLIWVRQSDEAEIRHAFDQTMIVRKLSPQARELADMYFFETLVRIHRTGEGAAYAGLKPAGRDLGPAIPAADVALRSGDVMPLANLLAVRMREGLHERYERAMAARSYNVQDVSAGREYIEAYVGYIHYVEGLYEASMKPATGHYPEAESIPH